MDQRSLPLGYSFLGNEPDPTVCCDLRGCQRQQAVDYKRLNCGHSFHTECLRDTCSDLDQSASNADRARLCPICHPLLEDRIRELSTTMNRLVKKDFKRHQSYAQTVRRLGFYYQKPQIHFPSSLYRYLAGDELNSDDDSDEESDDDPDNFEDAGESDQQDSKVDSLKSKLYERARAMKQDGQPINLLPRYVHSRQKPLVEQQQQQQQLPTTRKEDFHCQFAGCIKICKSAGGLTLHVRKMHRVQNN